VKIKRAFPSRTQLADIGQTSRANQSAVGRNEFTCAQLLGYEGSSKKAKLAYALSRNDAVGSETIGAVAQE
jgi:hypothetical protein